jgi:hypothetical protein
MRYLDLLDKFWGAHIFYQNITIVSFVDSLLGLTFVFYQNGDIINIYFVIIVASIN